VLFGVVLLAANFFFVASEFAIVKIRDSQIAARGLANDPRAETLRQIRASIDEYLSVVQLGITGATIGMGVVFDEGLGQAVEVLFLRLGWSGGWANFLSIVLAIALATFLTIVVGELVPKTIAIRHTERIALAVARPMRLLHRLLYVPIMVLNLSARLVLRVFGGDKHTKEVPTEEELRIILSESQDSGVIPFRRLMLFENVFDLGHATVRDAMRPRSVVRTLPCDGTRQTLLEAVSAYGFSRYPVVATETSDDEPPLGIVHVKDVLSRLEPSEALGSLLRGYPRFRPDTPLEYALSEFQRTSQHLGMVLNHEDKWVGLLAFEDVIEEIVGAIEDEFGQRHDVHLDELLTPERVLLDISARSIDEVIGIALSQVSLTGLPDGLSSDEIAGRLRERERSLSTYVGRGIAIPHTRIERLASSLAIFVRVAAGIPIANRRDVVQFVFILLVPAGTPRVHLQLLARIARIAESNVLLDRIAHATTKAEIIEAISATDRSSARA
jgi:CBS domain containing-hemolysin-like protein